MPAIKGKPVMARRSRVTLVCVICKKDYEQYSYRALTSKYCSNSCWSIRAHKICKHCGVSFGTVGHWGKDYCSKKCSSSSMIGELSPRWKDGKSLIQERARHSGDLTKWKRLVKIRDGNKCVKCGDSTYLHVHHIKSFSDFPEFASDINNGLTLCQFCHSVEHGRWVGAKSRNQRWQEFTGKQATLESTEEPFNQLNADTQTREVRPRSS